MVFKVMFFLSGTVVDCIALGVDLSNLRCYLGTLFYVLDCGLSYFFGK